MKKIIGALFSLAAVLLLVLAFPQNASAKDADGDIVIIIDPGHGSVDGGANQNGVGEERVNWAIATSLKAELETYWGVKVYLTRGSSEYNSNTGRARQGLELQADLVVSVHNNSGVAEAKGIEVYGTVNPSYSKITTSVGSSICEKVSVLGLRNRGYKTRASASNEGRDYYTVIDEAVRAGIPAIIIEHCFLSNPEDAAFIADPLNQKKVGTADAAAIAEYFGLAKRGVADGGSITLTRTYSANFVTSAKGTLQSSNTDVAAVNSNGVITAVGEGTAQITNTLADGKTETVTITVPAVKMVAIAAGISPTYYNADENINNDNIMLKGIYSDGSVKQITSGYSVGNAQMVSSGVYDFPISYNGFECSLRIYKTGRVGSYSDGASYKPGSNTDILVIPDVYQSVNTGINISLSPVASDYAGVTATPQQPEVVPDETTTAEPVTAEPTTPEPTTQEQETSAPDTQETETTEQITSGQAFDETTEVITTDKATVNEENGESDTSAEPTEEGTSAEPWQLALIIMIGVVGIAAGAASIIIFFKLRNR